MNENNEPVSGKSVSITPLDSRYGTIDPLQTTTANGKAVFNYTAPNDIKGLTSTTATISFTDEFDVTIIQNIVIQFSIEPNNYKFVNPTTPLAIKSPRQVENISVFLMDQDNEAVDGKIVSISPLDTKYGNITPLQSKTSGDGEATFAYTAPDDIRGLGSTTAVISFTDNFGQTITQNIVIQYTNTNNYRLVNPKNPYYIYSENEPSIFDIQLIDENGLPVLNARPCETPESTVTVDCVIPHAIDRRFGRFEGIYTPRDPDEPLDVDGYIYYRYVAPSPDEKAANGEDTTFTVVYIDEYGNIVAESESITLRMRY